MKANGSDNRIASKIRISSESTGTGTSWSMADGRALGVLSAGFGEVAGGKTLSVDAGLIVGAVLVEAAAFQAFLVVAHLAQLAVIVGDTFRCGRFRDGGAIVVGISGVVSDASAPWSVNDRLAFCVNTTGCLDGARIDALAVEARLVEGTIGILTAAGDAVSFIAELARRASGVGGAFQVLVKAAFLINLDALSGLCADAASLDLEAANGLLFGLTSESFAASAAHDVIRNSASGILTTRVLVAAINADLDSGRRKAANFS